MVLYLSYPTLSQPCLAPVNRSDLGLYREPKALHSLGLSFILETDRAITPTQSSGREVWQPSRQGPLQCLVSQGHSPAWRPHLPSRTCPAVSFPKVSGSKLPVPCLSPRQSSWQSLDSNFYLDCLLQGPQSMLHPCLSPGPRRSPWPFHHQGLSLTQTTVGATLGPRDIAIDLGQSRVRKSESGPQNAHCMLTILFFTATKAHIVSDPAGPGPPALSLACGPGGAFKENQARGCDDSR